MKIVCIITSSGDAYYCGNCFRDNLMAQAMKQAGHQVVIMPIYLPLKQKEFQADTPLFFPATSYYVGQKFFKDKPMPSWLKKLLGAQPFLDLAMSMAGTTTSDGMEDMTLSMITGEGVTFGYMVQEMIDWIVNKEQPDAVYISSSMLVGIAKALKEHAPSLKVICLAQDEEVWIDGLRESDAAQAWRGIAENLKYADAVITTSEYYKNKVLGMLKSNGQWPNDKGQYPSVHIVYPGVDIQQYATEDHPVDPTIGFFYRMNQADGLDVLAKAFVMLKQRGSIPNLKLRIGGGYTSQDKAFLKGVKQILSPYIKDVVMEDTYDWEHHAEFYKKISVITVPLQFEESVGLYLLEAFAAGVPAVEPNIGSFEEIVGKAGIIYQNNDALSLADALEEMLATPGLWQQFSTAAKTLSDERYNVDVTARRLDEIITNLNIK
ncbi:MAG: glycosyltransferase family 4 protein [Bacteroidaceae bacterium]|nr:glycosyltransferase family 4 protein [Bacteroidaceae bacterium]